MDKSRSLPDDLFLIDMSNIDEAGSGTTLSFSRSTTVLLTFTANRFTRSAARHYLEEFGIGAMDWRMLVMLTRSPDCSVAHASRTIGIDKAAVSRSLSRLEQAGLASAQCKHADKRRRGWSLTKAGHELHGKMLAHALERQQKLLDGFGIEEVEALNGYLRRMLQNLQDET